jgi:iron complex transport system substrate-binding protein
MMFKLLILLFLTFPLFTSERIIALSPAINEILFALGVGEQVVGNTDHCTYPKASLKVTKLGGYADPSLERVLALQPTLVILQQHNYRLASRLKQLNIPTKIIKIDSLVNINKAIIDIGKMVHAEKEAEEISSKIDKALISIQNIVQNKKIMIVFGHNTQLVKRIFVAGKNLYFNDIIQHSGNKNAFSSQKMSQPILNMENIIASDPDIVILLAHSMERFNVDATSVTKPWKQLPISAAKSDSIYIIDKQYSGIPSDRLVYFLQDFKRILNDYKQKTTAP